MTEDEKKAMMAIASRLDRMEQQLFTLSQELAERDYGVEAVAAAEATAKELGKLGAFRDDLHPYGALMKWYRQSSAH